MDVLVLSNVWATGSHSACAYCALDLGVGTTLMFQKELTMPMFPTKKINDDKYESCDDPEVSTSNTSNNTRDKDNDDNSASILGRILLDDDDGCNSQ